MGLVTAQIDAPSLTALLAAAHPQLALHLREETAADLDFAASLYASTRTAELAVVPWSDAEKTAFCRMQFNAQHTHYAAQYPGVQFMTIERDADDQRAQCERIGRVYIEQTPAAMLLMEITLSPEQRGAGIGAAITAALLRHARSNALPMHLHVEPLNPAKRLYERLGFVDVETSGFYRLMVCAAATL